LSAFFASQKNTIHCPLLIVNGWGQNSAVHWMDAFISIESPSYHANSFRCWSHSCLTFCRLLYPIRKDKTAKAKTFGAWRSRVEKVHHKLQNFCRVGQMRFPFLFETGQLLIDNC
jgi:hypothetical protein